MVGFTWYSLTDQVDWDTALREDNGRVNPCGLVDIDRKMRPVGRHMLSSSATGGAFSRREATV
jgi:hypothetical protein